MMRCKICNRVTPKGNPTSKFTIYRFKDPQNESLGIDINSEIKSCHACAGEAFDFKENK